MRVSNQNNSSAYIVGAVAGAAGGAAATAVSLAVNPFFYGNVVELATGYLFQDIPSKSLTILAGGAVGALAGVVRTAIDRQVGPQESGFVQVVLDGVAGVIAAPSLVFSKCMTFPIFDWSDAPAIVHPFVCAAVGGTAGFAFGPIAIAGSMAARMANGNVTFTSPVQWKEGRSS